MFRSEKGLPPWLRLAIARGLGWLPGPLLARILPASVGFRTSEVPAAATAPAGDRRVYIAPANSAGQAWQWMRAAERNLPSVGAISMTTVQDDEFRFAVDYAVPLGVYRWSRSWQRHQQRAVSAGFTHVIIESAKRLFGDVFPGSAEQEIAALQHAGIEVALVFHGSDIRLPSRHAASSEWSPFRDGLWPITSQLESIAARNFRLTESFNGPVFVSTPDLLDDVPRAVWLPVVVDVPTWATSRPPLSHDGPPRVAHAPSKAVVKGSDLVDPILARLDGEGLIDYVRVSGVAAADMPAVVSGVDIVLDQFRIGSYGVAACEAMAAGRIVVSHVSEQVRGYIANTAGVALPIVQATAGELESALRAIVADPSEAVAVAGRGPAFVAAVHNGRLSAEVLSGFLS